MRGSPWHDRQHTFLWLVLAIGWMAWIGLVSSQPQTPPASAAEAKWKALEASVAKSSEAVTFQTAEQGVPNVVVVRAALKDTDRICVEQVAPDKKTVVDCRTIGALRWWAAQGRWTGK